MSSFPEFNWNGNISIWFWIYEFWLFGWKLICAEKSLHMYAIGKSKDWKTLLARQARISVHYFSRFPFRVVDNWWIINFVHTAPFCFWFQIILVCIFICILSYFVKWLFLAIFVFCSFLACRTFKFDRNSQSCRIWFVWSVFYWACFYQAPLKISSL